jgi:hypothetical protein
VEQARTNWNDDRLDRLADQVTALREHMDARFEAQNARIDKRFDALQYSLIVTLASLLAAFAAIQF